MEEDDFSKLSIEERWTHPKWKARQSAYTDAAKQLMSGQPVVGVDEVRQCCGDSNVVALEAGISVFRAFVSTQPNPDAARAAALPLVLEKGLAALKPAVKQAALEAVLAAVEFADPGNVVSDLLQALAAAKSPKQIAAQVNALARIFTDFGSPVTDPKPVLQALPPLFANSDRNVRNSACELATALCRWLGQQRTLQALQSLKPVQISELEQRFSAIDFNAPVQRLTRQQAEQQAAAEAAAAQSQSQPGDDAMDVNMQTEEPEMEEEEIDPWVDMPEEDVLAKIDNSFYEEVTNTKWKVRFEALEALCDKLEKVPKIARNDEALGTLAASLLQVAQRDMNVSCGSASLRALAALASNLRQPFAPYAQRTLEAAVERFKDKKSSAVEQVGKCITAVFLYPLERRPQPVLDAVVDIGLAHRTPSVKLESANFLAKFLSEVPAPLPLADVKRTVPAGVKLLNETSEPLRDAAARVLATLVLLGGSQNVEPLFSGIDEHKKKRITDWIAKTTVKAVPQQQQQQRQQPQQPQQQQQQQPLRPQPLRQPQPQPPQPQSQQPQRMGGPPGVAPPAVAPNRLAKPAANLMQTPMQPRPGQRPLVPGPQIQARAPTQARPPQTQARAPQMQPRPQTQARPGPNQPMAMNIRPIAKPGSRPVQPMPLHRPPHPLNGGVNGFDADDSFDEIASPAGKAERPSFNSTPRMVKRSVYSAGITPARGFDTHRRRVDSPLRSPLAPPTFDETESLRDEVSRLQAELQGERIARLTAEKRLAEVQVISDNRISKMRDEIAGLKLHIQTQRAEFDEWLHLGGVRGSPEGVSQRLSSFHLEPSQPRARPRSMLDDTRRRSMPPVAPLMPVNTMSPKPAPAAREERDANWERAIQMTQNLKRRVEELKKSRNY